MTSPGFKRKLSAILMADVVGYSRMMGEDEADTLQTLNTYHGVMADLVNQHRGRIVDAPGDAVTNRDGYLSRNELKSPADPGERKRVLP